MAETNLVTVEPEGEKTLIKYLKRLGDGELGDMHVEILNYLARSISERGWVKPLMEVVKQLSEHHDDVKVKRAFNDLIQRQMILTDQKFTKFTGMLGAISFDKTKHRGHLETESGGNNVYTYGGIDLLALNTTLLCTVDCFTKCAQTGEKIHFKVENEQIVETNAHGMAGFAANWDGKSPLHSVAENSPLFINDAALEAWQAAHPDIEGTAIPADLFLWVGMGLAQELGNARFKLIGHSGG